MATHGRLQVDSIGGHMSGRVKLPADESTVPDAGWDIAGLQRAMAARSLSAVGLANAYLERIAAIDRDGPRLGAVIELNPRALDDARALDAERAAGRVRGPLHGIAMMLKDNIATLDDMQTTAGSLALLGSRPTASASLATRLREAGAVILGKTNLSEWANFRSSRSIGGWSGRGGLTRNPHALDRSASGSSTGSAVAVAASMCVAAIGTETNGSIVSPSSLCGVVGFKPTVGWISRSGVIPIAASQDTAGPIARCVADAALVFVALCAPDPGDAATSTVPAGARATLEAEIDAGLAMAAAGSALRGKRFGLLAGPLHEHPLMDTVRAALHAGGATSVPDLEFPNVETLLVASRTVCLYEFKDGLNAYLASLDPDSTAIRTLVDVIEFNERNADREMPFFGQDRMIASQACGGLDDPRYKRALVAARRLSRDEGIDALMRANRLDALVSLTAGPAPLNDWINGASALYGCSTPAAVAGYPHVTIPAGMVHGLPVGVSLFAGAWNDARLLGFAADLEARLQARRDPAYAETLTPP